jgi:hypothetical protein
MEIKQEVMEYLFGSNNALMIQNRYGLVTIDFFKLPLRNTMFKSF